MFCPKCGTQLPDNATFCSACGANVNSGSAQTPNQTPINFTPPAGSGPAAQALPMKWYKFLIYFAIWFGAVVNIISAVSLLTGAPYENQGVTAELVYSVFPQLKTYDMLYAVATIALGVYSFYVRNQLAHFKANGPKSLYWLRGLLGGTGAVYILAESTVVETVSAAGAIGSLAGALIVLALERVYFKKRADMFVN